MNKKVLENLTRIFIFLRFDIRNEKNRKIISIIIQHISNSFSNEKMCSAIYSVMPEWSNQLVLGESEIIEIKNNNDIKNFIIMSLNLANEDLINNNFDRAYDIMDMLHTLPEVIILNNKKSMKNYCKFYVKPFINKWRLSEFIYI